MANILPKEKQVRIIAALAECNSIRSIERQTGVHRDTIMRLGVRVGEACQVLLDEKMRGLTCNRIEIDELWGFIRMKEKTANQQLADLDYGDVWTFLAIDPQTKVIPSFLVGKRDLQYASTFLADLAGRLTNRIQLSSDAMHAYPLAVRRAFGSEVDYGQIVKKYSVPVPEDQRRYSPAGLVTIHKYTVAGQPDPDKICTSYIERSNLTMRNHCKRLARLTIAFSKKLENFKAAVALNLAYYNFVKMHTTLRRTPAEEAGIIGAAWTTENLVDAA
jgi:IS1 family transposase